MKKIKLLFICEDDFKLKGINDLFCDSSFTVVGKTHDGLKGIKLIDALHPDVVVLGMILKGVDGFGIINHIKLKKYGCKMVALSGIKNENVIKKAFSYGADYYIATPICDNVLKEWLKTLCDNTREHSSIIKKSFNVSFSEPQNKKILNCRCLSYNNNGCLSWRLGWKKQFFSNKDDDQED